MDGWLDGLKVASSCPRPAVKCGKLLGIVTYGTMLAPPAPTWPKLFVAFRRHSKCKNRRPSVPAAMQFTLEYKMRERDREREREGAYKKCQKHNCSRTARTRNPFEICQKLHRRRRRSRLQLRILIENFSRKMNPQRLFELHMCVRSPRERE